MKWLYKFLIIFILNLSFSVFVYSLEEGRDIKKLPAKRPKIKTSFTKAEIKEACDSLIEYLLIRIDDSGMYLYREHMDPLLAKEMHEKYNVLRHAGTMYSMAQYYERFPSEVLKKKIVLSAHFFKDNFIEKVREKEGLLAIWSDPTIIRNKKPIQSKLGAVGLGVFSLFYIEKLQPGFLSVKEFEALGDFLLFMQKENGSFYSKYLPEKNGRDDSWNSVYYPSQAALALLCLYEKDAQEKWLSGALNALEQLAKKYEKNPPIDHWYLVAYERLMALKRTPKISRTIQKTSQYVIKLIQALNLKQWKNIKEPECLGAFNYDARTCPVATRMEGLSASLNILPNKHPYVSQLEYTISLGLQFLLKSQIKDGAFKGGMPRSARMLPETFPNYEKKNKRAREIRIDYVQHTLSAFLRYLDLEETGYFEKKKE